ncbi:MAG: hypothetical protein H7X95_05175, partial [Deltaproteobacteria bacterium]|nr:hypothetical protein [Deltaproteobacteria bacterium]
AGIASLAVCGAAGALLFGVTAASCGSDSKVKTGTGGSGMTGTGGNGMSSTGGAGGLGGSDGTGGMGGTTTTACKDDKIPVNADIATDTTWECNTYTLTKPIYIVGGATLTIAAGSTIFGAGSTDNPATLIASREGKLVAVGTAERPIVFTSVFPAGMRVPGDSLAGVVLLGKATINNGTCQNDPNTATTTCETPGFRQGNIEGIPATELKGLYGGADDTHNCGELKYVRVEFAGFVIGDGNELNGITVAACGSATKLSYLQVHRGFDDGIEFFGGTASVDHVVISGSTDDGLDWDNGWRGKAQFVIVHQAYGKGDKGFEADNLGGAETSEPRSNAEIWNATLIAESPSTKIGMHLREGLRGKFRNLIVLNFGGGALDEDAAMVVPATEWPTYVSIENSVFFGGPLGKDETTVATMNNDMGFDETMALSDAARMNTTVDPMLGSTVIATPNYVPGNAAAVSGKATPTGAGLDTTATYAGAVAPGATELWYAGWTKFPEN